MPLTDFAYLVFGPDYSSDSTAIIQTESLKTRIVGVDSLEKAEETARELVSDGVQLIELCGWFGPQGAARIIEAVGEKVPVGFIAHGSDSIDSMYKLFSD
ncbi:MAG: DUF6506 family protein [Anaerolineales bacterium]